MSKHKEACEALRMVFSLNPLIVGSCAWLVGLLIAMPCLGDEPLAVPLAPIFAAGQEWSIRLCGQPTAKAIVGRVEPWKHKTVVHVSIVELSDLQNQSDMHITMIAHMPFDAQAFALSVNRLLAVNVAPIQEFSSGYAKWKEVHGGVFTVSISEALGFGQQPQTCDGS
jgi:hypothetical protein